MNGEIKEELFDLPSSSCQTSNDETSMEFLHFEVEGMIAELKAEVQDEDEPGTSQELFLTLEPERMKNVKHEGEEKTIPIAPIDSTDTDSPLRNGKVRKKKEKPLKMNLKEPRYSKPRGNCPPEMSKNAYYYQRLKDRMSPEDWAMRLQRQRERRQMLTPEMKEERLRRARERRNELKALQTLEQKAEESAKTAARKARLLSNPEKREKYRDIARKHYLKRLEAETEEQKAIRRQKALEFKRNRIQNETPQERELRLLKLRIGAQKRYAQLRIEKEASEVKEFDNELEEMKPESSNCSMDS